MNPSLFRVVGSVVVCLWVLSLPTTARAQAEDEPFRRGISARGDKKWGEMADEMRKAIAINATESARKVQVRRGFVGVGGNSTEYLPHFYLGEALKNQQNCAGALGEWEISEDQKVVQAVQQPYADLRAGYKDCAAKGVLLREEYRQQQTVTEQPYNDAVNNYKRLESLKGNNPDLFKSELDTDVERARVELGSAYKALLKAKQTRLAADFSESRSATTRAASLLRPLEAKLLGDIDRRKLVQQQAAEVQTILAGAETTDRQVDATKAALSPELTGLRENARGLVRSARERIGVAQTTQNGAAATEAVRIAQDASDAFKKLLDEVTKAARGDFEQRFEQALAAAGEQFSFVTNSFTTLQRLVAEKPDSMTPEMSTEREALDKSRIQLQRRFDNSKKTESLAGVEETTRLLTDIRTKIDALIQKFGPASLRDRGVHPALEQASRLYFSGEYQQVLSALDPLGSALDVLLQVHVHLFKAASLYALYVRSGETNEKMRNDAVASIHRCKEIEPGFRPSSKAFSPRFISFFESGGAAGVPSAAPAPAK